MQIQQRVLRVAAAASVTVFIVAGAFGPAYAADNTSDGTSSQKTHQSDTGHAKGRANHTDGNASTTGDSTSPQPESTADQNDGGANAGSCDESTTTGSTDTSTDDTTSDDTASDDTSTGSTDSTESTDSTDSTETNNYCSTRDGSASQNGEGDGAATGKPCAGCVGKADNKNPKGQYPDGSDANNGYECDGNNGIGKSNPAHTGCTSDEVAPEEGDQTEETCPPDSTDCPPPCPAGATECQSPGEVLGVQAERSGANRPAAAVDPASSGLLPETGAGRYGIPIVAGLALLGAGGVLLARKRPQAGR